MEVSMNVILIAALLPCIVLLYYIYKKDKIEKEPTGLLVKLFIFGCISTIPAIILEMVGTGVLTAVGLDPSSMPFILIENFLVVRHLQGAQVDLVLEFEIDGIRLVTHQFCLQDVGALLDAVELDRAVVAAEDILIHFFGSFRRQGNRREGDCLTRRFFNEPGGNGVGLGQGRDAGKQHSQQGQSHDKILFHQTNNY